MKWLACLTFLFMSLTTSIHAKEIQQLAHTGGLCQKYQSLKKDHPSQRIYYETTTTGKKCYHLHAKEDHASGLPVWTLTKGVSLPKKKINCIGQPLEKSSWCPIYDTNRVQDYWNYDSPKTKEYEPRGR